MIDKLAWLYIKNRKILSTLSYGKTKYYIPGGKRELGESDQQALCREIKEELSVELQEDSLEYYGTFSAQADGHPDGIIVQMTCYFADYTGKLAVDSEIAEFLWLNTHNTELISDVDKLIFADLKNKDLID